MSNLSTCKRLQEQIDFWERIKNEQYHAELCAKEHKTDNSLSAIPKVQEEVTDIEIKLKLQMEEKEKALIEIEELRQKLVETEQNLKENKNENQQLRDKVNYIRCLN